VGGLNLAPATGEAAGEPRRHTMGKRTVDIPEEFCINGDVVVTIKYGPDGVEQPPEFRYCSQHALSATPRLMA